MMGKVKGTYTKTTTKTKTYYKKKGQDKCPSCGRYMKKG